MPSRVTAAAVIKIAAREIGYREQSGNRNKFGRAYGVDGTAWCAQFIWWCLNQAGDLLGIPKTAWCPTLLADARKRDLIIRDPARGDRSGTPRAGDIGLVQRSGQPNGAKHVFFVEKYLGDGYVQTIEGNTNNSGSAQGVGVFRLKRKLTDLIVIYRPKYAAPTSSGGGGGSKPATRTVDLSKVVAAAQRDSDRPQGGTTSGASDDVKIVEAALKAEGLLPSKYAADGSFGSLTVDAYAAWQRRCGYRGNDADGIPGRASLEKLGKKHGFKVVA